MLPWIMLGASLLQNQRGKEDSRRQALQQLMMQHAQSLGADIAPLQAQAQAKAINDRPMVDPGLLASAIGSTVKSESVDDKLSKEMAKRGLMKGYLPFDDESRDPEGDLAAALRAGQDRNYGGWGGYYGGGR